MFERSGSSREVWEVQGGLERSGKSGEVQGGMERFKEEFQEVFKIIPWGQLFSTLENFNGAGDSNVINSMLQI